MLKSFRSWVLPHARPPGLRLGVWRQASREPKKGSITEDTLDRNYSSEDPKQYWYRLMNGARHPAPRPTLLFEERNLNLTVWVILEGI